MKNEDVELFRAACKNVRPIKSKIASRCDPPPFKKKALSQRDQSLDPHFLAFSDIPKTQHTTDSRISFSTAGPQQKRLRDFRAGKLKIESRLDLHRMTANAAETAIQQYIHYCQQQNKTVLLLIHGKGNFSKNGAPVLKSFVLDWLQNHPAVLAVESAKPKDGGTGAVYVLIKKGGVHAR